MGLGLVAPQHMESSWTRAQTRVPCIGRWILNHCTTREALIFFLLFLLFLSFLKIFIFLFIYLYLATLGLRCCAQAFCSGPERGLLFFAVRWLLIAVASFAAELGL